MLKKLTDYNTGKAMSSTMITATYAGTTLSFIPGERTVKIVGTNDGRTKTVHRLTNHHKAQASYERAVAIVMRDFWKKVYQEIPNHSPEILKGMI